ncbi:MAG TPA: FtsX-like permease family protein, partial [Burkholderiales bacterium]|nr:FtsX-like permease family protein [Burkholderiales bacterium]
RAVPGVRRVAVANWFGGIYIDRKNFFPQFAVDPAPYFSMYREYRIPEDQLRNFLRDRKGVVIGRKLADTYGFRVGDTVPLQGTIFPGVWQFNVRAIYDGAQPTTDTSQFFFHWDYLNETLKDKSPRRANQAGIYVVEIENPDDAAGVSQAIDATFRNSLAETLTETERSFQIGFVKQTETIVIAIRVVSFVVIFIILAVMANTMAMTARERIAEYATLKALGFAPGWVAQLILGESLAIALIGCAAGIALTYPVADWFAWRMGTLFPVFEVKSFTVVMQVLAALAVGVIAALFPMRRARSVGIVEGLRSIG